VVQIGHGVHVEIAQSAGELGAAVESSTPAAIVAQHQAGELPQLHFFPVQGELHRDVLQLARAAQVAFQLDDAGIAQVHIGADWASLEPAVPHVFRGQPQGEVRIREREGCFFGADLEIDTAIGGLDIGEAGALLGAAFGGGRAGHLSCAKQKPLYIPVIVAVDQVQAGRQGVICELEVGDFQAALPQ